MKPVFQWDMVGKPRYAEYIKNATRNIREIHSSASPSRIEAICDILDTIVGMALDEISLQLREEQEERVRIAERTKESKRKYETRQRESTHEGEKV